MVGSAQPVHRPPGGRVASPSVRPVSTGAGGRWSLLGDGSLVLQVDQSLLSIVQPWVPLCAPALGGTAMAGATIDVVEGPSTPGHRRDPPTLRLGDVEARVRAASGQVMLTGPSGVSGTLDLEHHRSEIRVADATSRAPADVHSMLTVAAAFMLGRLDGVLVHSAAVVSPGGGAWLLLGDARAGKTTTALNLVTSGWNYLSDDQVVLSRARDTCVWVEGWLRPFHVDAGWTVGRASERRESVDPSSVGPGQWQRRATLGGAVILDLRPASATAIVPLGQAEALAALVRQAPWLLADREKAPTLLSLLVAVMRRPVFRLILGRDTYHDGARLLECLGPLLAME